MKWKHLLLPTRARELFGKGSTPRNPADQRSRFGQDYDRTIFSTPVRRLQDKAQVFVMDPSDAVRTRLTHSLEVSTLARDLAAEIARWINEKEGIGDDGVRAIESIAATCGLIHDLGNPPFGHAGEKAISYWFKKRLDEDPAFLSFGKKQNLKKSQLAQDFLRFEGNAQTLRIVSKLQMLADLHGLNLTCGTLSAACKYVAASHKVTEEQHERTKPGYFASESDLISKVREKTKTGECRNPITFLVEASDDIVYSTIDIEDAIRKKVVRWGDVEGELGKHADAHILERCLKKSRDYLANGRLGLQSDAFDEAMSQAFRTFAIAELVPSVSEEFKKQYKAIMRGEYHKELYEDCSASSLIKACKEVGKRMIYSNKETLRLEVMGRKVICDLMDVFWEGAREGSRTRKTTDFPGKIFALFSRNYARVYDASIHEGRLPEEYCQMQLVTDYVCGMTDSFACRLHKELFNE